MVYVDLECNISNWSAPTIFSFQFVCNIILELTLISKQSFDFQKLSRLQNENLCANPWNSKRKTAEILLFYRNRRLPQERITFRGYITCLFKSDVSTGLVYKPAIAKSRNQCSKWATVSTGEDEGSLGWRTWTWLKRLVRYWRELNTP